MTVLNREVFDKQTASIFPSWTSRVRSPSPAFRFIDLRAYRFWKYSKYSVKKQMREFPTVFEKVAVASKATYWRAFRVFVTASPGSNEPSAPFSPGCAVGVNCWELAKLPELTDGYARVATCRLGDAPRSVRSG